MRENRCGWRRLGKRLHGRLGRGGGGLVGIALLLLLALPAAAQAATNRDLLSDAT